MRRLLDIVLVLLFGCAAFIGLVYEPLFVFGCGWEGLKLGAAGPCAQDWVGRAWLEYLKVEPLYGNAPVWLQLVNEFDSFLFGWFYVLSLVVFLSGRTHLAWYRNLATFVAGMMTYAMVFYLSWEALTYRETGADLKAVISYNGPWLATFLLLMLRLYLLPAPAPMNRSAA